MVDYPRVGSTVHFQVARLLYFAVQIAVVQELFVGCFATDVVQAMALCCACVCVHEYETDCPKSHQTHNPQVWR